MSCQHDSSIFLKVLALHGCLQVWLDSHFSHLAKSHPLAARVSMLDRQSLLSGNTALTGGLGHWWWWVWVFLIIQYSSFTLQILKWLDTVVQGGGGTGGSSTWVTLLGNITFYSSCGVGGPNFKSQNFSKSRYENFDEIASKYIYIYSICTILYDQKRNVAGAEMKSHLSLGASRFWASCMKVVQWTVSYAPGGKSLRDVNAKTKVTALAKTYSIPPDKGPK